MNLKTYYINNHRIKYQEILSDDSVFEKFYLIENPYQENIVAIPDGCVDLQFTWEDTSGCRGYIVGTFLHGRISSTSIYRRCFGLKLRPGLIFSGLKKDIEGFIDSRIPLSEFIDSSNLEKALSEQETFPDMIEVASYFFYDQRVEQAHNIASSTAEIILNTSGGNRVSEMTKSLGYSQRYVNNVFKQAYGLSIKKYADIIRIQTAIQYLQTDDIMDVIAGLGYYDQAHFIRDFKQYTSLTPKFFVDQVRRNKASIIV